MENCKVCGNPINPQDGRCLRCEDALDEQKTDEFFGDRQEEEKDDERKDAD